MTDAPHTVLFNQETGEVVEECPHCKELEVQVQMLEREARTYRAKITRLQSDDEAKAKRHKLWPIAEVIYEWWKVACLHPKAKFTYSDFDDMRVRLSNEGAEEVLKGIAGAAYNPSTTLLENGRTKRYDDIELICRKPAKLRDFTERAPGRKDTDDWKIWLSDHVKALAPNEHERMLNQLKHALEMEKT